MKLLEALLQLGLAASERQARGLIMRGDVLVDDKPVTSPSANCQPEASVRLRSGVNPAERLRGADKLAPVLAASGIAVAGRIALDLGVATGGFTQVLLAAEAAMVYAVDVAYGTILPELRTNPRVVLLERTNARLLSRAHLPEPPEVVVGDLSFISWRAVLPAVAPLLAPGADLLLLVKPQFELAALGEHVAGGIVRSTADRLRALAGLYNAFTDNGLAVTRVLPAAITGTRGNQEYFVQAKRDGQSAIESEYLRLIAAAVEGGRC
jgi:23S rRNA (cytidine1920-2'-O)/16S rRNA (cytidine1409-2'-O)-methyltransferase